MPSAPKEKRHRKEHIIIIIKWLLLLLFGWECSSVGKRIRLACRWGRFDALMWQGIFLPKSTFGADSLTVSVHPPCAITCIYIRAQVKDPVVYVRVWWNVETLNHPTRTVSWVGWLCCSWLSPGKATQISLQKNPVGTIVVTSKKYNNKTVFCCVLLLSVMFGRHPVSPTSGSIISSCFHTLLCLDSILYPQPPLLLPIPKIRQWHLIMLLFHSVWLRRLSTTWDGVILLNCFYVLSCLDCIACPQHPDSK